MRPLLFFLVALLSLPSFAQRPAAPGRPDPWMVARQLAARREAKAAAARRAAAQRLGLTPDQARRYAASRQRQSQRLREATRQLRASYPPHPTLEQRRQLRTRLQKTLNRIVAEGERERAALIPTRARGKRLRNPHEDRGGEARGHHGTVQTRLP